MFPKNIHFLPRQPVVLNANANAMNTIIFSERYANANLIDQQKLFAFITFAKKNIMEYGFFNKIVFCEILGKF